MSQEDLQSNENSEDKSFPALVLLSARQNLGSGVGYSTGYTTIKELLFTRVGESWFPFLDLRGHRFLNNKYAANAGLGVRYFSESHCRIVGVNFYCDYRQMYHSHFNQLGIGFEWIASRWNVQLNGYLPIGTKRDRVCSNFEASDGFYLVKKKYKVPLGGLNLEGDVKINDSDRFSIYLLGGPYYYCGNRCKNVFGGVLGALVKYKQIAALRISGSYDAVFKKRAQMGIELSFPLGKVKEDLSPCAFSKNILFDSIKRNEIIVADKRCTWKWNY